MWLELLIIHYPDTEVSQSSCNPIITYQSMRERIVKRLSTEKFIEEEGNGIGICYVIEINRVKVQQMGAEV